MSGGGGLAAAAQAAAKGAPAPTQPCPLKVAPLITIAAPKIVLVKKAYQTDPHRIKVHLTTDQKFIGSGTLSCAQSGQIRVFDAQRGGKLLPLPLALTGTQLTGGLDVYVEASAVSAAMADTTLTLTITGGDKTIVNSPASDTLTRLLLQLNIFKARPEDGSEPVQLDEVHKIDPGRAVLVQGTTVTRLWAQRAKLAVARAKPLDYKGKLVLKPISESIEAFASDKEKPGGGQVPLSGASLKFANDTIDQAKGMTLWVQGKTLSGKMSDTGWTIELADLPNQEGDRVTMTAIQAELALYKSRTDPPAAVPKPDAFSDADKFSKGRYVHVQNAGFHHGRGMIALKKVKPDGFVGKLVLTAYDAKQQPSYSAVKAGAPKVRIFEEEEAKSGQAAKGLPLEVDHPVGYPADGKFFWVEGTTVSTALRDCELRLGVQEVDNGCDRVEFTVVRFSNLKADIPATPARMNRNRWTGGPANNPTPRHDFIAGANDPAKHFSDDFSVNLPLPLVESSVPNADQIKLSVELQPAGLKIPVSWSPIRSFDDKADIKSLPGNAEDPGLHPDATDTQKATMEANAAGSFRIRAYIDCNGNNKFDERDSAGVRVDREPFILMNLVLFRVQGVNNTSAANSAAHKPIPVGRTLSASGIFKAGGVPTGISTGDFAGTGNDAMDMKAVIRVIGGGSDGLRGLSPDCYLFAGWLNNELNCPTAPNPSNWGEDATHHHQRPPAAPAPRPLLGLRSYWLLDGARISGPICDAGGRYGHTRGTGGDSCIGTMAGAEPPVNKIADLSGIGQRWTVANSDSPGGPISRTHPSDALAQLVRFTFNLNFQSALLVWTNSNKIPGPPASATAKTDPCCRLYSTVQTQTWEVRFESTFDAAYTETSVVAKTITVTKDANATRRAMPVKGTNLETRGPGGLDTGQYDKPFDPAHPENP